MASDPNPSSDESSKLDEADRASSAALEAAEEKVWRVIRERRPESLRELREFLSEQDMPRDERSLLWHAVLRLVNRNELELTSDRRLHVPAGAALPE
jgi:hypothetical protein